MIPIMEKFVEVSEAMKTQKNHLRNRFSIPEKVILCDILRSLC